MSQRGSAMKTAFALDVSSNCFVISYNTTIKYLDQTFSLTLLHYPLLFCHKENITARVYYVDWKNRWKFLYEYHMDKMENLGTP